MTAASITATTASTAFSGALSTAADAQAAAAEVCQSAMAALSGPADLGMLFVSPHHLDHVTAVAETVSRCSGARALLGCTAEAIVGGDKEVEHQPAVSLWLARLPSVRLTPMHLRYERTPEGGTIVGWPEDLPATWPRDSTLLVLGEPFSFPCDLLLHRLNEDQPGVPVIGGMASAAHQPGVNRLILGNEVHSEGAVAVLIDGPVRIHAVVSQGCRPIGRPMIVTKADRHLIETLGGRPALAQLQELFASLSPAEQRSVQSGLHLGIVTNEYQERFGRGDFLVRNVIGADGDTGAIAVGDYVRVGQTVQFHIRDAKTADEDLRELLAGLRTGAQSGRREDKAAESKGPGATEESPGGRIDHASHLAAAALLFTCNGRGTRLFPEPHHDATALREALGSIPVAGFFAAGEIGPVAGKNYVHGFTASVAIFSPGQESGGRGRESVKPARS